MRNIDLHKKNIAAGLIILLIVPFVTIPQKAHALFGIGDVVLDPTNLIQNTITAFAAPVTSHAGVSTALSTAGTTISTAASATKDLKDSITDYVLKPLALALGRAAVKSITTSTVNWINGGFQGSPAFATDLKKNLRQVADGEAQKFLSDLSNNASIHSPFIDSLVTNVGAGYYLYSGRGALAAQLKDTLGESSRDAAAFRAGDFQQGGWNAYWSTYMNPANNAFGAQMIASQALADRVSSTINQRTQELAWGSGFMSWRGDCVPTTSAPANTSGVTVSGGASTTSTDGVTVSSGSNQTAAYAEEGVTLSDAEQCQEHEIVTPGSYIAHKGNKTTDAVVDQLLVAQSIDQIIGALAQQLISQALGGAGGLRGSSNPSQGGGVSPVASTNGSTQTALLTAGDGLAVAIRTSVSQVTAWKTDSQSIATLAASAQSACIRVDPTIVSQTIVPALTKAQAAVIKADSLLGTLNGLTTQLQNNTSRSSAYQVVSSSYQQLQDSSALPTQNVMTQASADAKTSNDTVLPSLFDTLSQYVATNCQTTSTETRRGRTIDPGF